MILSLQPEDPIGIRWAHLALLVEFALELKKALQSINEQSFNHFVLKMGKREIIYIVKLDLYF